MSNQDDEKPIGSAMPLGPNWVALVMMDGTVIIQELSKVYVGGSGEIVNLMDQSKPIESANHFLSEVDAEQLGVRTIKLERDGSIVADPDAMSPSGMLSDEAFQVFPSSRESSVKYFKRKPTPSDW